MKRLFAILLCGLLLTGCVARNIPQEATIPIKPTETQATELVTEAPVVTEPATEPSVTVTIYYGNENADGFETTAITMAELDPHLLVEQLINADVLPEGTTLLSQTLDGTCLHLDFNEAFRDHLNTMGTAGERMLMGSVVNTFITANAGVESIFITVNGEIIESGHVVYDFEMSFFE